MDPKAADLTILFAGMRGFTGISEALQPEALREYINEYLTHMSAIIRSGYNGTLDKYMGDAIMAFWGHRWWIRGMRAMGCLPAWRCKRRANC